MAHVRGWLQAVILGATGVYFLVNLISGNITNYIAEKFIWLSWIAAVLFLTLAALRAGAAWQGHAHDHGDHDHDAHAHHDHPHAGGIGAWIGLGIVALPALFGLLVPSQPLGSDAIDKPPSSRLGGVEVSSGDTLGVAPDQRTVLDWLRTFQREGDPVAFNGQAASVTGFVYRDDRFDPATQFMVTRFVISCCVADAQPIGLVVETPRAADLAEDTWVQVRGTLQAQPFDDEVTPVLVAYEDGVSTIDQPKHPYLYP